MTTQNLLTVKLRNGAIVYAKKSKFGINAVSYCNLTQASNAQIKLKDQGIDCSIYRAPGNASVTYIIIK